MLNDEALNATEVASLLHIGRNAVYELAKSGKLPSYKAGRKLLFALKDVQGYLESTRTSSVLSIGGGPSPSGVATNIESAAADFVIGGQGIASDIFVDRLQTLGFPARRKPCGSYEALRGIYAGQTDAALIHLFDQRTNSYNIPYVQRLVPGQPVVVFRLVRRWQGFAVSPGNPKKISSWGALLRDNVRLANRQKGCGSRVLQDEKLLSMEADPWTIKGYESDYATGLAAAYAVAAGLADVAVVGEQIASQIDGVEFVQLQQEWLDFAVSKEGKGRELCRILKSFFEDEAFKREYSRIVHGDAESLGAIVYES